MGVLLPRVGFFLGRGRGEVFLGISLLERVQIKYPIAQNILYIKGRSITDLSSWFGLVFVCEKWKRLWKEVWIEEESTVRKRLSWEDLDSGRWTIKRMDADGEWISLDIVCQVSVLLWKSNFMQSLCPRSSCCLRELGVNCTQLYRVQFALCSW